MRRIILSLYDTLNFTKYWNTFSGLNGGYSLIQVQMSINKKKSKTIDNYSICVCNACACLVECGQKQNRLFSI